MPPCSDDYFEQHVGPAIDNFNIATTAASAGWAVIHA